MKILLVLLMVSIFSPGQSYGNDSERWLHEYERTQDLIDLRLYYMVKSKLRTKQDKIYFLNLSTRDKKIYARYLNGNKSFEFRKAQTRFFNW